MSALFAPRGGKAELEHGQQFAPLFDRDGLLPVIAAEAKTGEILMFAWMNTLALETTLRTGYGTFWSRSRAKLWVKGEESGNRLAVVEARTDCDQDVLLLRVTVEGDGVACHTGAHSCFYRQLDLTLASPGPVTLKPID